MSLEFRKKRYHYYRNLINSVEDNKQKIFIKDDVLGEGWQGKVYKYYKKNNNAKNIYGPIAVKKIYLNRRQNKFIEDKYNLKALKYEPYIELASNQLINQLVLQGISPNFMLHYTHTIVPRTNICDWDYPSKMYHYNELIKDAITYTEWDDEEHEIHVWYNAFFQITTALFALQKYFNMTHLDLHSDNILVKKIKPGGYWVYIINGKKYKVPNLGYQFIILDFGHARIPQYFVSQYKRRKKIHRGFDIKELFTSISFNTAPKEFRKDVNYVIKRLSKNEDFDIIIEELWKNKYVYDTGTGKDKVMKSRLLDTFNLDKRINLKYFPQELRYLVIN